MLITFEMPVGVGGRCVCGRGGGENMADFLCLKENPFTLTRPRGYKTFFMLNSVEHEIFPAHKC